MNEQATLTSTIDMLSEAEQHMGAASEAVFQLHRGNVPSPEGLGHALASSAKLLQIVAVMFTTLSGALGDAVERERAEKATPIEEYEPVIARV